MVGLVHSGRCSLAGVVGPVQASRVGHFGAAGVGVSVQASLCGRLGAGLLLYLSWSRHLDACVSV